MEEFSDWFYYVLRRAARDSKFATTMLKDSGRILRHYELNAEEIEILTSFRTEEEIQAYYYAIPDDRRIRPKMGLIGLYALFGGIIVLAVILYIIGSTYFEGIIGSLGLPLWLEINLIIRYVIAYI